MKKRTYERNIQNEPRASSSKKDFAILPLAKVASKVAETCFGGAVGGLLNDDLRVRGISNVAQFGRTKFAADVLDGIGGCDLLVAADIERVTDCFGNCETEVERKASWNGTESVDDTPRFIEGNLAGSIASCNLQGVFEADRAKECNEGGCELSPPLIGKDGGHHCAAPLDCSELTGDDGRKRKIAPHPRSKNHTPKDHDANDIKGWTLARDSKSQSSTDDDHQFNAVHLRSAWDHHIRRYLLATEMIGQEAKTELSDNSSG